MPRRIPPFRLVAEPLTLEAEQAAGFEWGDGEIGTRHRIGGDPEDLPGIDIPRCPDCRQPMSFYGQLDSIGDDLVLADAGVVAVFVCFDCFQAAARVGYDVRPLPASSRALRCRAAAASGWR